MELSIFGLLEYGEIMSMQVYLKRRKSRYGRGQTVEWYSLDVLQMFRFYYRSEQGKPIFVFSVSQNYQD
jgi:hypothetical protein